VKIFVSYSRRDADFAQQVYDYFKDSGHDIFTDVNNIKLGDVWSNTIENNISNCDVFVIIVTHAALRSPEVEKEVLSAKTQNKKIIPAVHKSVQYNDIKWDLNKIQGIEFEDKYELARTLYLKIANNQGEKASNPSLTVSRRQRSNLKIIIPIVAVGAIIGLTIIIIINQTRQPGQPEQTEQVPTTREELGNVSVSIPQNAAASNGSSYIPSTLSVNTPTQVTWTNNDSVVHTVTSGSPFSRQTDSEGVGQLFDSGAIMPQGTFAHTFNETGAFEYYCILYPFSMSGQIIVN
jgi:plastocyanin